MKGSHWQSRARAAGLTQRTIAELTRRDESSVGRALSGTRQRAEAAAPYVAIILAWEIMTPEQRVDWLRLAAAVTAEEGTGS